jgi:hypothetical protein
MKRSSDHQLTKEDDNEGAQGSVGSVAFYFPRASNEEMQQRRILHVQQQQNSSVQGTTGPDALVESSGFDPCPPHLCIDKIKGQELVRKYHSQPELLNQPIAARMHGFQTELFKLIPKELLAPKQPRQEAPVAVPPVELKAPEHPVQEAPVVAPVDIPAETKEEDATDDGGGGRAFAKANDPGWTLVEEFENIVLYCSVDNKFNKMGGGTLRLDRSDQGARPRMVVRTVAGKILANMTILSKQTFTSVGDKQITFYGVADAAKGAQVFSIKTAGAADCLKALKALANE